MIMNKVLKLHHHFHPPLILPNSISSISKPIQLWAPHPHQQNVSVSLQVRAAAAAAADAHNVFPSFWPNQKQQQEDDVSGLLEEVGLDSPVYKKTLRLVECSMFAAISALAYLLTNSLAIENYFGCFFALPIVISSMRWGVAAGRKAMVATAVLLLVLSGPVKALTYLLMHGLLGFTMGSLWRLQVRWSLSIFLCSLVKAVGALGFVLVSSFLIRENILALITINVHATFTLIFNSLGFSTVPSMNTIYAIFGSLLLLNSCFVVFLLHILYALFLTRLGMKDSLALPRWISNAL